MEIIHLSVDTPMQVHDYVCALGFFDGVHLGHQQLLKEVELYYKSSNKTCCMWF